MEENRKRSLYEDDADDAGEFREKQRITEEETERTGNEDGDIDILSWLSIDDETVAELSKLLETELTSPPVKVRFINNPYSSPEIFQFSSSFVTINGNEESCGSSFSDSGSSAMVSVDLSGFSREAVVGASDGWLSGGAWDADAEGVRGWMDADGEVCLVGGMDGCDCYSEYDDEMLAKFIGEEFFES